MANEANMSFWAPIREGHADNSFVLLDRRLLITALLTFVGYYAGSLVGFALTFQPHPVSVLWPPNTILLAALLLTPPRAWAVLLLAALPAHIISQVQSHVPLPMMFCYFISNSCEAIIGAACIRYFIRGQLRFDDLRSVAIFCIFAGLIGPFLSSFLDAGFVRLNQWGVYDYWSNWRIRLFSNALTALTLAPAIVIWFARPGWRKRGFKHWLEVSLLFLGLTVVCYAGLYRESPPADPVLFCAPIPFLLWAALRLGARGTSTAILMVTFLAIWSAARGHGPFTAGSPEHNALSIQMFLIAVAVPFLFLAGVIEERATAETHLEESEQRFRIVADAAPLLLWMSAPDKSCTFLNKAWLAFTGRTLDQELGDGWKEGVHPDDIDECFERYATAFDAREPFDSQYRLNRHDGEYRWITANGMPRYDSHGNFLGYVGGCLDVTELLQKEEALHAIEDRVALAAEAAHLGVWELDPTNNNMWVSDKLRALFQLDAERLSYEAFQERVHPEDRLDRDSAVKNAIATNGVFEAEYRIVLPDGTVRWIGGRGRCLSNGDGKNTRLVGVSMDVTERRQAEELLGLATEASPSGILLVNAEDQIVLVNAHIEEAFGYEREELIGKPVGLLLPERFAARRAAHSADFLSEERVRPMGPGSESFGRRKDGTEFPIEISLNPIRTRQGMLTLVAVTDISARKAAEEEARVRRDQIDLLTRVSLLGEMTASIAHELNQPLSAIVSNASAGMRFMDNRNADLSTIREILVDVAADGRRAYEVIRNVRNTVKKGGTIRQPISLNEVISNVAHMVQPDATAQSCVVRTSLADDLPAILGDPLQIQQVLINLIANAFDAMRETSAAHRHVDVVTKPNGDGTVRVEVRDHGLGISEDSQTRLFEQFFTTKEDGLGMGLAIVRSIIEAHGGRIAAENNEPAGACFYFTLPAADSEAA
ncbi:MAG: PAS domain S-box protein [Chthoniobacterales bacterium]